ncbi:RNA polymerase sigma factor [Streptomyces mirabilis]|uniref:RNA polymerase sigma factor n=1 Tax=Streptomyces mirabilis TaxID=68239 RepID=UPI0036326D25
MNQTSDEAARVEDAALTRAAQAGEVTVLGLLLERHRAGMRTVALSVLGPGPDVDDVLQDAAVTALRRVGDVGDPAAVGAWLRMIVRNASRSLLRSSVPVQPIDDLHLPATDAGPERWLEQHAMRDWIWELQIHGSELLILENSGHFGHLEEPEACSQAVTRFVTAMNSPDS